MQYGSSEAYLPRRMVISEGCLSLPWNVPVLCGTFSIGTSCEYAFKGELCGKWALYMWRKAGMEALLGPSGEACAHSCLVQGELQGVHMWQGVCWWFGWAEHTEHIGLVAGPIQHIQYPAQQRPWEPGKPALDRLRWGRLVKTHLVWSRGQGEIEKWFNSIPFEKKKSQILPGNCISAVWEAGLSKDGQ